MGVRGIHIVSAWHSWSDILVVTPSKVLPTPRFHPHPSRCICTPAFHTVNWELRDITRIKINSTPILTRPLVTCQAFLFHILHPDEIRSFPMLSSDRNLLHGSCVCHKQVSHAEKNREQSQNNQKLTCPEPRNACHIREEGLCIVVQRRGTC